MKIEELGHQLLIAFATTPDQRSVHGRRHPLPAILAMATVAMLSGARSLYAIAQWGRHQSPELVQALGFTKVKTPSVSTLHEVFKVLDVAAFEAALGDWTREEFGDEKKRIAVDDEALHGMHGETVPGIAVLAAYQIKDILDLEQGEER